MSISAAATNGLSSNEAGSKEAGSKEAGSKEAGSKEAGSKEAGSVEPLVDAARYGVVPTLMDGLLHDVRNPLNALNIHLELLSGRLKEELGELSPNQEKSLQAMRAQVQRVDGLLRQFADFIVFRGAGPGEADLSSVTERALQVLCHESRRRRLRLAVCIAPGVRARLEDVGELGFLVVQPLLAALSQAPVETEVHVAVRAEEAGAVLEVGAGGGDGSGGQGEAQALAALEHRCRQLGVVLERGPGRLRLRFARG